MPYFHGQPLSTSASRIGFAATIAIVAAIAGLMLGNSSAPKHLVALAQPTPVAVDATVKRAIADAYAKGKGDGIEVGYKQATADLNKLSQVAIGGVNEGGERFCQMNDGIGYDGTMKAGAFIANDQCIAYRQGRNELRL